MIGQGGLEQARQEHTERMIQAPVYTAAHLLAVEEGFDPDALLDFLLQYVEENWRGEAKQLDPECGVDVLASLAHCAFMFGVLAAKQARVPA